MQLDRLLQKEILLSLKSFYGRNRPTTGNEIAGYGAPDFEGNIRYLCEHGLVADIRAAGFGSVEMHAGYRITAKGLDFLEDDGGLSAILNVVTVRLDADALKELITTKISEADLSEQEKIYLLDHLKNISAETLKQSAFHLVRKGLDAALESPDSLQKLFQNIFKI